LVKIQLHRTGTMQSHFMFRLADHKSTCILLDDECTDPFRTVFLACSRKGNECVSCTTIRNKHLGTVHYVMVSIFYRPCSHIGYIGTDRKSTRLNSSHVSISYAVCCL